MSWANMRELIFQERKLLEPIPNPEFFKESAFETNHSAVLAAYLRTKDQIDAAVAYFAQNLEWPDLAPLEKYFVAARLDFAWEMTSILGTSRDGTPIVAFPAPERCKTPELLEWLLGDIWPYGCGRFLQAQRWTGDRSTELRRGANSESAELGKADCVA